MSDSDLIRPHDPFSGHEAPAPAVEVTEPEKAAQPATPPAEPAQKPPARRGRRPRRTPSAAEVEKSARRARR